jgi:hypothetical protein
MTLEQDIAFWRAASEKAKKRDTFLYYLGVYVGLRIAQNDHVLSAKPVVPDADIEHT